MSSLKNTPAANNHPFEPARLRSECSEARVNVNISTSKYQHGCLVSTKFYHVVLAAAVVFSCRAHVDRLLLPLGASSITSSTHLRHQPLVDLRDHSPLPSFLTCCFPSLERKQFPPETKRVIGIEKLTTHAKKEREVNKCQELLLPNYVGRGGAGGAYLYQMSVMRL